MNADLSVLTLVRGRRRHLINLLHGIAWQTVRPREVVIAWMQDQPERDLPDPGCPVRSVFVPGEPMPLAAARNAAASAATGRGFVFLDVDCIPNPKLVESYAGALADRDAVFMGEVLYLPPGLPASILDPQALNAGGRPHPSKPAFPDSGSVEEPDTGQLWGLSFALNAFLWRRLGGMDEGYLGYGGEETDFAARLFQEGVELFRQSGARVWHQHHPVISPPLQHFDAIVTNARLYRRKWNRWCMDYWLDQFEKMKLITRCDGKLTVLRHPTEREIAAAQTSATTLFS